MTPRARASDLTETIGTGGAASWLHGHTHRLRDDRVGEDHKRVVASHGHGRENGAFYPSLVLDVAR